MRLQLQARANLRSMQQMAHDETLHPPFRPTTHFSPGRRGRSAGPAGSSAVSPELNFGEFLQRQQLHTEKKEEHVHAVADACRMAVSQRPGLSPGTQRILAAKAKGPRHVCCSPQRACNSCTFLATARRQCPNRLWCALGLQQADCGLRPCVLLVH